MIVLCYNKYSHQIGGYIYFCQERQVKRDRKLRFINLINFQYGIIRRCSLYPGSRKICTVNTWRGWLPNACTVRTTYAYVNLRCIRPINIHDFNGGNIYVRVGVKYFFSDRANMIAIGTGYT